MSGNGLPRYLRECMAAAGFEAASDLARVSGVGGSAIGKWLAGEDIPTPSRLRAVAGPLGVPLLELMVVAGHLSAAEADMADAPASTAPAFTELRSRVAGSSLDSETKRDLDDDLKFCQRKWDRASKLLANNP